MSKLRTLGPRLLSHKGALRDGWKARVDDYAITCEWAVDGQILLVGDVAGGIHAFNGKSGAILWRRRDNHGDGLLAMCVHPSGKCFATAGQDGQIIIQRPQKDKILNELDLGQNWVECIKWSPNGKGLAIASSRHVYVFDSEGKETWRSEKHPSTVSAIEWSNSSELATACYGMVSFFDVVNKKLKQRLEWQGSLVSMVLSPNGNVVACGSQDNTVHFWRRSTGHDSMMSGYAGKPSNLDFDNSGTLLATSGGKSVTVWSFQDDGPEGTLPGKLDMHSQTISSLAFIPKGMRLASGAKDGAVILWELKNDGQGEAIGAGLMEDPVSTIVWRPDGRALAAVNAGGDVNTWRVGA